MSAFIIICLIAIYMIVVGRKEVRKNEGSIISGKGNIELTNLENPVCTEDGIILQNLYASICGTDVAVYKHGTGLGHKITIGGEFGHEVVCRVKEVGKNVTDIKVGGRVYPYPRFVTGDKRRAGTIGAFSKFIKAPVAHMGVEVYKISDKITDKVASLIEPFTVGCRGARRALPKQGESAVVFGAGTIGIAAAISLKFFGSVRIRERAASYLSLRRKISRSISFL